MMRIVILILFLCISGFIAPPAQADDGLPVDFDTCAADGAAYLNQAAPGDSGLTVKLVACVQYTIQQATATMLNGISNYMTATVGAVLVFALLLFTIHIFMENDRPEIKSISFLIRLALVLMFSYNLGGFGTVLFDIESELIQWVTNGNSPWALMDYFLGVALGFAPKMALYQGLLGILAAALFSSAVGFAVFLSGFMALLEMILFMFDVAYTYLGAIVAIAFHIIISAFAIPAGAVPATEKYVWKWLNSLIAAMLVPVLLLGMVNIFLGIFNVLIGNVLMILGVQCANPGDLTTCAAADFHSLWQEGVPSSFWTMPTDPGFESELSATNPTGTDMPPMLNALNPYMKFGVSAFPFTFPKLNFGNGANDWAVLTQLTFSFVALWVFASMMKSITRKMPELAEGIAQSASGVQMMRSPVTKPMQNMMKRLQSAGGRT